MMDDIFSIIIDDKNSMVRKRQGQGGGTAQQGEEGIECWVSHMV